MERPTLNCYKAIVGLSAFQQLIQPHNLYWAFRKAEALYEKSDAVFDRAELARFKLSLETELDRIRVDFEDAKYRLSPMRLLPMPKKSKEGQERMRQAFQFSIRDQVAWIAIVNVLGPELDAKMPAWSYGHRLYRRIYNRKRREYRYQRSATHLYREFRKSWPLFRSHISASSRYALNQEPVDDHQNSIRTDEEIPAFARRVFWSRRGPFNSIYAANFDLEWFYPSLQIEPIQQNFERFSQTYSSDPRFASVITRMLRFRVDSSSLSDTMASTSEPRTKPGRFNAIPTGLWVAGFLSNVGMLGLDLKSQRLALERGVAHFRFVDDYTVLGRSFDSVVGWIAHYQSELKNSLGLKINFDKTNPPEVGKYLAGFGASAEFTEEAEFASLVRSPTQLATRTLAQISFLDQDDFDLLSHDMQLERLEQLRLLLFQDVDEAEIRADTRMSFAATRLANLAPRLVSSDVRDLRSAEIARQLAALRNRPRSSRKGQSEIKSRIQRLEKRLVDVLDKEERSRRDAAHRIYNDLQAAFEKQPDKLTLLTGIVKFCRLTGYPGLRRLMHVLNAPDGSVQRRYLAATALQALSKSVLLSSSILQNRESLHREKTSARDHLFEIARFDDTEVTKNFRDRYYASSLKFFCAALATAVEVLRRDVVHSDLSERLKLACKRLGFPRWPSIVRRTDWDDWPVWLFLMETFLVNQKSAGPSRLWRWGALRLDPADKTHWQVLRLYPKEQPDSEKTIGSRKRLWRAGDAGWLRDARGATSEKNQDERPKPFSFDDYISRESLSFEDWINIVTEIEAQNPFDLRASEWTALELFRQIVLKASETGIPANPFNIKFKLRLLSAAGVATWESWRSICSQDNVDIETSPAHDFRLLFTTLPNDSESAYAPVTYGILLKMLLSKALDIPDIWNLPGMTGARLGSIFTEVEHLAVSSATNAVLEQCLAPRFVEYRSTARRVAAASKKAIRRRLLKIAKAVSGAQDTLVRYQVAIRADKPRQLIPVSIFQLRSQFSESVEDSEP